MLRMRRGFEKKNEQFDLGNLQSCLTGCRVRVGYWNVQRTATWAFHFKIFEAFLSYFMLTLLDFSDETVFLLCFLFSEDIFWGEYGAFNRKPFVLILVLFNPVVRKNFNFFFPARNHKLFLKLHCWPCLVGFVWKVFETWGGIF